MKSSVLRRIVINSSYTITIATSIYYYSSVKLGFKASVAVRILGLTVMVLGSMVAYKIHSMYPKKHDEPSDFKELLTTGPYAYCRHPLYATLALMQLAIPLVALSWQGLAASLATIPLWILLVRVEEEELIRYWGDRYLEYKRRVPALIPRFKRDSES